ncbi:MULTISPECIES: methyl-accepting chemotaxis protein [unclassified Aureimonas]|uniref:methyl-accepting chemotaxis protein n=1 Tax=unclassified Aureimonas TaxID=2615206 RepID=UPI001FCD9099|nr:MULTISPECIES: methyl-accepting chemotaxis protein [unclassified Aureimonas]
MSVIFGVIALVIVMLSWLTLGGLRSLNSGTIDVADNWLPRTVASGRIETALNDLRVAYGQHLVEVNIHRMKDALAVAHEKEAALKASLATYEAMISTDEERRIFAAIPTAVAEYIQHGAYMLEMSEGNAKDLGGYLFGHAMGDAAAIVEKATSALVAYDSEGAAASKAESGATYDAVMAKIFGAVLFVAAVLAAAAVYVLRGIARPVEGITQSMIRLAEGNTAATIPYANRPDEIGQMAGAVEIFRQAAIVKARLEGEAEANRLRTEGERGKLIEEANRLAQKRLQEATADLAAGLRRMASGELRFQLDVPLSPEFESLRHDLNSAVLQLGETLTAVVTSASEIDGRSWEISQASDDLARRTEQQAASLEETAAALSTITLNVTNSNKQVEEARAISARANQSAVRSGEIVAGAVAAMGRIEESSGKIASIITVIDEIAFQTNLLALNAGVEAARAGEAGRGFAVVAQEVRGLAQRSAQAAKEIKSLIDQSSHEVECGVQLVSETGSSLKDIVEHVVSIDTSMDAIASSTKEQTLGLREVNLSILQMDKVTQQNAAMVEETNAASATLAREAAQLKQLMTQFELPRAAAPARRDQPKAQRSPTRAAA